MGNVKKIRKIVMFVCYVCNWKGELGGLHPFSLFFIN